MCNCSIRIRSQIFRRNLQNILDTSCPSLIFLLLHSASSKSTCNRLLNYPLRVYSNKHCASDSSSSNKKITPSCSWSKSQESNNKMDKFLNCIETPLDIWACFWELRRRCSMIKSECSLMQAKELSKS